MFNPEDREPPTEVVVEPARPRLAAKKKYSYLQKFDVRLNGNLLTPSVAETDKDCWRSYYEWLRYLLLKNVIHLKK